MLVSSQAVMFTEIDVHGHLVWHAPGGLRKVAPFGERSIFCAAAPLPPHVNDCAPPARAGCWRGPLATPSSGCKVGLVITL